MALSFLQTYSVLTLTLFTTGWARNKADREVFWSTFVILTDSGL